MKTPCAELGYKVGDKFRVVECRAGFEKGQIVTLFRDDGDDLPLFEGKNTEYKNANGNDGAYLRLEDVEKINQEDSMSADNDLIKDEVIQPLNKADVLEILILLSSLETWSFSTRQALPDHLFDRLNGVIETLTDKVLEL